MEALEAIMTRKSVREFEDRPLPKEIILKLLAAGMQSPTARHGEPWHFVVITEREKLARVKGFSPYAAMAESAPAGILVCADTTNEKSKGYFVQDCAAASENILLAAHALSLGGVWTGVYPDEKKMQGFRELLGIPAHIAPISFLVVGFPKKSEAASPRYDEKKAHFGGW